MPRRLHRRRRPFYCSSSAVRSTIAVHTITFQIHTRAYTWCYRRFLCRIDRRFCSGLHSSRVVGRRQQVLPGRGVCGGEGGAWRRAWRRVGSSCHRLQTLTGIYLSTLNSDALDMQKVSCFTVYHHTIIFLLFVYHYLSVVHYILYFFSCRQ